MRIIEKIRQKVVDGKVTCPVCGQVIEWGERGPKKHCAHLVDWSTIPHPTLPPIAIFVREYNTFYPKWVAKALEGIAYPPTPSVIARALNEISFHRNWGRVWGYFFPGSMMGWGDYFDGGWITYRKRDYYFSADVIRAGAIRQVMENRKWSKRDWIRFWEANQENISLSGASGRFFQLAHKE